MTEPDLLITSRDGTPIALFTSGNGPPLILVHGTTGDHTTFRVVGPMLGARRTVFAMDRRGRGASGDTLPYAIEREFEDLAAVADALAADAGHAVDVVGHSYGGRSALGAALLTDSIGRVVSYEGAPTPAGASYHPVGIEARLRERLAAGDRDGALAAFMTEVVGMSAADLAAYREEPVWPARAAAAGTILRELEAETDPAASLDRLAAVRQPVLQILGGSSLPVFQTATQALDARLHDGRIVVIDGARHAAHHTHPDAFVRAVRDFLDVPAAVR
jgi:pimeloyl-ACP methyl ester carboxylesterase